MGGLAQETGANMRPKMAFAGGEAAMLALGCSGLLGRTGRVLVTGRALPVASGGWAFRGGRSFNNYPKNNYFRHLIRVKHLDYSG